MSFLSKLTIAAMAVLGVRALTGKRSANHTRGPQEGTSTGPTKAPKLPPKLAAAAKRSTAPAAAGRKTVSKVRSRKRPVRRISAKRAQT
jgi:hypothetical protein